MLKKIAILIGIISVVTAFYTPILIAWGILGFASLALFLTYLFFRLKPWSEIKELSPEANRILRKYRHLYMVPWEDEDISETTDKLAWAGIILAVIGCFQAFWWGVAIGLANYFLMEYLSRRFNYHQLFLEYRDLTAHEEVLEYLEHKREKSS